MLLLPPLPCLRAVPAAALAGAESDASADVAAKDVGACAADACADDDENEEEGDAPWALAEVARFGAFRLVMRAFRSIVESSTSSWME